MYIYKYIYIPTYTLTEHIGGVRIMDYCAGSGALCILMYACAYVYICIYMNECAYMLIYIHIYIYIYICIYICIYIYIYIYMYIYIYIYIYVCVCIYAYTCMFNGIKGVSAARRLWIMAVVCYVHVYSCM